MPKRPENYMADRRDRILEAVEGCCRQKGWNAVTLRDVATAAGLSKGGLYVHFSSKTQLLEAILRRNLEQIGMIAEVADPEAFVGWVLRNISYVVGPEGRESAISQSELQLDGLRNAELKPLVEEVARHAVRTLENMVRKFCPALDRQEVGDRALAIVFFLEGLRNFIAMSGSAPTEQLQRIATRQLRTILSCAAD